MHAGKQLFAPHGHARAQGGDDDVAGQEIAGVHLFDLNAAGLLCSALQKQSSITV